MKETGLIIKTNRPTRANGKWSCEFHRNIGGENVNPVLPLPQDN